MELTQDFTVDPDELWEAVSDPRRMDWLGDEVEFDLRPGGEGRVVDDGCARRLVIERVDAGHHLSFHWWPEGGDDLISRVELTVSPHPNGSRLVVRETLTNGAQAHHTTASARADGVATGGWVLRWGLRLVVLGVATDHSRLGGTARLTPVR